MLKTIAPEVLIDIDKITMVKYVEVTDQFDEKHVVIHFGQKWIELDPSFTLEEIRSAVNGGCYYRSQYLDQAGYVDICVVHDDISEYENTGNKNDKFRRCRRNRPLDFSWMFSPFSEPIQEPPEPKRRTLWDRLNGR